MDKLSTRRIWIAVLTFAWILLIAIYRMTSGGLDVGSTLWVVNFLAAACAVGIMLSGIGTLARRRNDR